MITTSEENKIASRIKKIIAEKFALNEDEIKNNAHFQDDLGIDSLDILELQMEVEKEFDIKIEDEETEKMVTVNAIIGLIEKKSS